MSKVAYTPDNAPSARAGRPVRPNLCEPGSTCRLTLSFSIFFDGTRNHLTEDEPSGAHSNVARLFKACEERNNEGVYRLYVQGVGTPFPEIGEPRPHKDGAAKGTMGAERIRYAFLYIANEVSRKVSRRLLVPDRPRDITNAVKNDDLLPRWKRQLTHMLTASENPKIDGIVFDLFGFSRGAAAARSFLNQLQRHFCDVRGFYCGVPMRVRFMGLFDTVASVGYADSFPLPVEGHQGWGDESLLTIPDDVEQCVHFVAAHEARASFPVDLARRPHAYQSNCLEVVYPGMHSDVGGGYGLYSQGKGTWFPDGRVGQTHADKLSQIALNDMYERALAAKVPLRSREDVDRAGLQDEFAIRPELKAAFDAYMAAVAPDGSGRSVEAQVLAHRRPYLGWRKQILNRDEFARQLFVRRSGGQDRNDLIEANDEMIRQLQEIASFPQRQREHMRRGGTGPDHRPLPPPLAYEFREDWEEAPAPAQGVAAFFAQYVHDSRAHFLLTDPQDEREHRDIHDRLEATDRRYQQDLERHRQDMASGRAHRGSDHMIMQRTQAPRDPLTPRQRSILDVYRRGENPLYTDEYPASSTDDVLDGRDLVQRIGGRREPSWSYLHKRQIFAISRMKY
ncbi:DUF2235 domain-containing protein [Luteimonas sp. SJ-92]|uniref:DUF2235 domain-containing protein n=1 Tax=Luteimonas salinisoli TaxID=2752307 RepID=A0A853JIU4_9GAMM|nr:DUF2235 domain-containing protein [Luteimonas salinisoli]NZA28499.1 DUF2235 domain-containing protein [Luteimonas salinisoli]